MCKFFFFKQKTAYELRISDWSSDVCSSDLDPIASDLRERIVLAAHYGQFRPGQQFTDGLEHGARAPQMVVLPHGAYRLGAGADDTRADHVERPHAALRLDAGFAVSTPEITGSEESRVGDGGVGTCRSRGVRA